MARRGLGGKTGIRCLHIFQPRLTRGIAFCILSVNLFFDKIYILENKTNNKVMFYDSGKNLHPLELEKSLIPKAGDPSMHKMLQEPGV